MDNNYLLVANTVQLKLHGSLLFLAIFDLFSMSLDATLLNYILFENSKPPESNGVNHFISFVLLLHQYTLPFSCPAK